mgnify:CR=1 FL=1
MKYKFLCCFILLVIGLSPMTLAYSTSYSWSVLDSSIETSAQSSANVQNDNFLNLDAESAILIEQNSGQILYSHNIHEKLHPASVTKIMSLLLIMEALDSGKITLETQIPCSENAANMGGSQIWLDPRENLSVNDMLKAIAVVSANDCVTAMAEYLGGSTENFVKMMNEKAKELGMNDTNFVNCHGLDEDDHLTSAYDIALMSRELLTKHPQITNYTTIWTDSLRDGKSALSNTNKLVRNYSGCTGLKTGSTSKALFNLSASATRNDLSLISVIMKAPTSALRFSNAIKLLDYLNEYTDFHFKEEEALQEKAGYPEREKHYEKHEEFKKTIQELYEYLQEYEGPTDRFSELVQKNVIDWLFGHIKTYDRSVAKFIFMKQNPDRC